MRVFDIVEKEVFGLISVLKKLEKCTFKKF